MHLRKDVSDSAMLHATMRMRPCCMREMRSALWCDAAIIKGAVRGNGAVGTRAGIGEMGQEL